MLLISAVLWLGDVLSKGDLLLTVVAVLTYLAFSVLFLLMLITGRTHRYRSVMLMAAALALPLDFIPWMIETYGSMLLTDETIYSSGASFCPLTMPMIIVPALVKRVVIFPGELLPTAAHGAFSVMFTLWVGASLSVGRGWCSWGCYYGGWDELFSRVRRRPLIRHERMGAGGGSCPSGCSWRSSCFQR
jgi:ferredoxin-type protein NapH